MKIQETLVHVAPLLQMIFIDVSLCLFLLHNPVAFTFAALITYSHTPLVTST